MIDIKTALLCLGLASILFSLMLSLSAGDSGSKGTISILTWARLAQGVAFLLFSCRGEIPDLISKNVGNSILFAGLALECAAVWSFVTRARLKHILFPVLPILILILNAGMMADASEEVKTAAASFIVAILMAVFSAVFFRYRNNESRLALIIAVVDAIIAVVNIARGTTALLSPDFGLLTPGTVQYLAIGGFLLFVFSNGFGFLLLVKEDDNRRFRESQKRYLSEMTLREQRLNSFFRGATAGLALIDTEMKYIHINDTLADMNGLSAEEHVGKTIWEVLPTVATLVEPLFRKVIATGEPVLNVELSGETPSQPGSLRHWLESVFPIPGANGYPEGVGAIVVEITELKRVQEEHLKLKERLQRAEKMEALGTLAGGVAHDLNNVLGVIVGYSELLSYDLAEAGQNGAMAMEILKSGQRAAAMVQDLLTLARRGVQSREVLNLNRIIGDFQASPEFAELCSRHRNIRVETDLDVDLLNVSGSALHLGTTIMNLVSNAVEAMPEGGTVTVKTANCYLDRPISGYDEVRDGDYVVLTLSDTGEGIPADALKHIFEPFYTKKVMGRSGTGLGLAVVWGTVKDHLGYINVQSREGKGTVFTLYFPVTREEISHERVPLSASEFMGNNESILIVDDIEEQRELAGKMLTRLNYNVMSVSSGEEAVEYLRHNACDLVVLDMIMDPGIDGLETYSRILEIRPHQKAIIVSGFSETERVNNARELGAGAYVKKPYVLEKLGSAVRMELDRPQAPSVNRHDTPLH